VTTNPPGRGRYGLARWLRPARRSAASSDLTVTGHAPRLALALLAALAVALPLLLGAGTAQAADGAVDTKVEQLRGLAGTQQGRDLLDLLGDPAVRARLLSAPPAAISMGPGFSLAETLDEQLASIRQRIAALSAELPHFPAELRRAHLTMLSVLAASGALWPGFYCVAFAFCGFVAEMLFRMATAEWRHHFTTAPLATFGNRLLVTGERLGYALLGVLVSAGGSLGAYLLFRWPPIVGPLVLGFLIALVKLRTVSVLLRFLLSPGSARLRLVPLTDAAAVFWRRWLTVLAGVAALGWQAAASAALLGVSAAAEAVLSQAIGLVLVGLGIFVVWRTPPLRPGSAPRRRGAAVPVLVTLYLPLIWTAFLIGAAPLGTLLLTAVVLPPALFVARSAVARIARGAGLDLDQAATLGLAGPAPAEVMLERGAQSLVLIVAALLLIHIWRIDLGLLSGADTPRARLLRGACEAVLILLLADLVWQAVRVLLETQFAHAASEGSAEAEVQRRARLRTLLPLLRTVMFIVLAAIAAMSALSALGVQIGPLLAGAGVVGVAVGLGAQALVRDVISGVFFLLDDAFRVGEYIETGTFSGTVEAFTLRSIKLRHYKGQLQTIPFGDIKAVTNYSRDWVSEEMPIGVSYDTDLDLVERVVAQVSEQVAADPVFAPVIIEPMRSLGVSTLGDFAIQITLTVKTKPRQQFAVRREIYRRIKTAFADAGIRFAIPTVHVASGDAESAAAAKVLDIRSGAARA